MSSDGRICSFKALLRALTPRPDVSGRAFCAWLIRVNAVLAAALIVAEVVGGVAGVVVGIGRASSDASTVAWDFVW